MPPKSRTLSDLITCSICLERFKQPKTLPCMHTFCLECIGKCLKLHNFSCELECALCKRNVRFAHSRDIKYLPVDHVIVQISDLVDAEHQASKVINDQLVVRLCDLCKMKESCTEIVPNALSRCQKCKLSFCNECSVKHNSNPMFSSHISFDLRDSSIFCKQHYDNVIEFFCKNCLFLMCTVCVLEHDSTHNLEHWDEVLLSKCEKVLTETMQMASKKSQEIKSHIKKLETLRQTYQESLFCTQLRIKSKTNDLIEMIRKREKKLLTECQNKFDNIFKEVGLDVIADLKFNQTRMDLLCEDLNATLLDKNKLKCLFAFQNLSKFHSVVQNFSLDTIVKASCFSSLSSSPPSSGRLRAMNKTICFLPDQLNESLLQIGTLSECNVHSVVDLDPESFTSQARQSSSNDASSGHKRVKLILNAIDKFGHKKDSTKSYGRMKSSDVMSVGAGEVAASTQLAATATVNVDLSATSADSTNILNNKISDICTINNNINDNNFDNTKSNSSISNNNTNNNADNNEPDADVHSSTESEIVSSSPTAITFSSDVVLVGSHHSISNSGEKLTLGPSNIIIDSVSPNSSGSITIHSNNNNNAGATNVCPSSILHLYSNLTLTMNISSIGSLLGNLVASCCLAFYEMGTLHNDNYQQVGDARPAFHSPPQLSINFLNASLLPAASSQAAATSASGSGATSPSSSSSSSSLLNQSMGTSHQSNWYLIVGESQRLHVFNSSGLSVRIIGWGTVAPLAISVAPNGLVYVADAKLKSIRYYNTHLNWEDHSWRPNMFEFPSDLAMISTDDIIVADPVKKQVSRHDASTGLFLMTYRDPSEDYEMPSFIYVKNDEEVYILDVAKSSIFVFSENGYLIKKIRLTLRAAASHHQSPVRQLSPTSPPPSSPTPSSPSFVLRPSSLNAVCSKPSLPSVSACWQADRHNVNGFSVDGHGNILICDYIRDQIIIYSPDGQESHSLSTCSPDIQLKRPTRIIFSKTRDKIAVLEHDEPNNSSSIKLINLH